MGASEVSCLAMTCNLSWAVIVLSLLDRFVPKMHGHVSNDPHTQSAFVPSGKFVSTRLNHVHRLQGACITVCMRYLEKDVMDSEDLTVAWLNQSDLLLQVKNLGYSTPRGASVIKNHVPPG